MKLTTTDLLKTIAEALFFTALFVLAVYIGATL